MIIFTIIVIQIPYTLRTISDLDKAVPKNGGVRKVNSLCATAVNYFYSYFILQYIYCYCIKCQQVLYNLYGFYGMQHVRTAYLFFKSFATFASVLYWIYYTNSSRRREFVYPIQHGRECCK
jgi:hypothetical protein